MNTNETVLILENDWNGKTIPMVRSRGGVWAVKNILDNLVSTDCKPWPQPEVIQKQVKSLHLKDFAGEQQRQLTENLGHYSDLQSLHSEDAITWSVFGTIKCASVGVQERWLADFFALVGLQASPAQPQFRLWERIPHPETGGTQGPEIDASIITEDAQILIECKWNAKEDLHQGVNKDKGQIHLRGECLVKQTNPKPHSAVIGLGLYADSFISRVPAGVFYNEINWHEVCSMQSHPLVNELMEYYKWKLRHTISPKGKTN